MNNDEEKKADAKKPKPTSRVNRVELRTTDEENELIKRCAEHFASVGLATSEVSEFIRNLVVLYAIEHGLPLFEGDKPGSVGENEDKRRLQTKQDKIAEGSRRLKNRKVAP